MMAVRAPQMRQSLRRIVRDALSHEHGPQIGVPQPEGPELIALFGDRPAGERRHQDADLQGRSSRAERHGENAQVQTGRLRRKKLRQIERGEIAGRIVEKHVFRTGVRCVDPAVFRAGMPLIDGRVVLRPRIGTNPGRPSDPVPQIPRLDGLADFPVDSTFELPIAVCLQARQKTHWESVTLLFEFWPETV